MMFIFLASIFLGLSFSAFAEKSWVFLCAGQSNMVGLDSTSKVPLEHRYVLKNVSRSTNTPFTPLEFGKKPYEVTKGHGLGPEYSFSKIMSGAFPEQKIFVLKFASSGVGLDKTLGKIAGQKTGNRRKNFFPGDSLTDSATGVIYENMIKSFQKNLTRLKNSNISYEIKGVLWMQGEGDASTLSAASRYAENLALFKSRFYEDIKVKKSVLFLFGEALPFPDNLPSRLIDENVEAFKRSQKSAASNSGDERAIPYAYYIPTDQCEMKRDKLHYTVNGQITLGKAMADTLLSLQGYSGETSPIIKKKSFIKRDYIEFDILGRKFDF